MNSGIQIHPRIIQVIQKQVMELLKRPSDSVKYAPNESDILDIQADIYGPVGTPYAGGSFRCKLVLSNEFPKVPPKGFFLTKIFHPNVSEKGEICVNTLKKDWDPSNWSFQHVFEVIRCLLIVPFPESALNEEAGKVFMEDYEEYFTHARLITELYALPKEKPVTGMILSPAEKPEPMDISYENSQSEATKKFFPTPIIPNTFSTDNQFSKGNNTEPLFSPMKGERPDDVLMTVTNSYNANPLSPIDVSLLKKSVSVPFGAVGGTHAVSTPTSTGGSNASLSAKKENDDKKKWRKRI